MKIARAFAEIIRDEPVVRELWVSENVEEFGRVLWLIVDPIDIDAERELYGDPVDRLYDRFPKGDFSVMVLNPLQTIGDVHRSLRQDAEQIPLRAD